MRSERDNLVESSCPRRTKSEHKKPSTYKMIEYLTLGLLGECTSEFSSSDEEYWGPHTKVYDSSDGEEYIVKSSKHQEDGLDKPENLIWENNPTSMKSFPFSKVESFVLPVEGSNPVDYFLHILTDKILNEIVLHMGIIRLSHAQDYWKTDPLFSIPIFPANMSRNRFFLILRVLHFAKTPDDQEPTPSDRLYKIRNIINLFNSRMSEIYYPGRELSVESKFLWRGRLIFRQYVPNKLHKDGIKLFLLTTATGMVIKCHVQMGMIDDLEVVMSLMDGLLNVGHSLYVDNYFNTYELASLLTEERTHCSGTIKRNRGTLPKDVTATKLKTGETYSKYANGVMVGKWREKNKDITYISNNNSHQLYNKYSGQKISIYDYRLSVIKSLLKQLPPVASVPQQNDHVVKLRENTRGGKIMRKQCKSCYSKGKRRDTPYVCTICKGSPGYSLDCVKIIHKQIT